MIDTLRLAKSFETQFTKLQSELLAESIAAAIAGEVATKADIEALRQDLKMLEQRMVRWLIVMLAAAILLQLVAMITNVTVKI